MKTSAHTGKLAVETSQENENEAEQWKNKYLRALADYQNLVKRSDQETRDIRRFAAQGVMEKLLPVVDIFRRAQDHLKDEGLELAIRELSALLSTYGVEKIDVHGKPFDPYTMDCVDVVKGAEHTVQSVLVDGYSMHGKVLRAAKVTVGGKAEQVEEERV